MNLTGNAETRQELHGSVNEEYSLEGTLGGMNSLAGALNGLRKIRGYSAYEIALLNGFAGTEEEWLASLRGEKGDPGAVDFEKLTEEQIALLKGDPFTYEDFTTEQLAELKGEKGDSIRVTSTSPSHTDGGYNIIYLSDGSTITIKNGSKGSNGSTGSKGADGIGIDSIEFKERTASGNVYKIVLDNETSYDFTAPIGPKGADGEGSDGQRGGKFLKITTSPSSYTSTINGITPSYRIALSTVKSQASVSDVIAGDAIMYSYYIYPVLYVDTTAVYCGARLNIRGATGASGTNGTNGTDGKDGKDGADGQDGYTPVRGSDYWTAEDIAEIKSYVDSAILGGEW